MKPFFLIIWAAAIGQLAILTFEPGQQKEVQVNNGDGKPYGYLESHLIESREGMRKSMTATLDRPWSDRCGEARKNFLSGVNEYYWQRKNQYERYAEIHGKLGADYIAEAWSSSEDKRIDRLTQEAYANGYIRPSDFKGYARDLITDIIKDELATGSGCAG